VRSWDDWKATQERKAEKEAKYSRVPVDMEGELANQPPEPSKEANKWALKVNLAELAGGKWWDVIEPGEDWEPLPADQVEGVKKACEMAYEGLCARYERLMIADQQQKWLRTAARSGTMKDRLNSMSMIVTMCPIFSFRYLRLILKAASMKGSTEAHLGVDAFRTVMISAVLPDRHCVRLEEYRFPPKFDVATDLKVAAVAFFEDRVSRAMAHFVNVLDRGSNDQLKFFKVACCKAVAELFKSKPEQERRLLKIAINKFGDKKGLVAAKMAESLHECLKLNWSLRKPVVGEIRFLLGRPNLPHKSIIRCAKFLTKLRLTEVDGKLVMAVVNQYIMMLRTIIDPKKPELVKKKGQSYAKALAKLRKKKSQVMQEEDNTLIIQLLTGLSRALPCLPPKMNATLTTEMVDSLCKICHVVKAFNVRIAILVFLFKIRDKFKIRSERLYRLVYEQLAYTEIYSASNKNDLFKAITDMVAEPGSTDRSLALLRRTLEAAVHWDVPLTMTSLLMVRKALEAPELDLKVFFKKDTEACRKTALDALPKEEKEKAELEYDCKKREPEFSRAQATPMWELLALRHHYHPLISQHATTMLRGKLPKHPGNPFENLGAKHFLVRFCNMSVKQKGSAPEALKNALPVSDPKFLQQDLPVHERFFRRYFQDSAVASERELKKQKKTDQASKKAAHHAAEEGDEQEADLEDDEADAYLDDILSGQNAGGGADGPDDSDDGSWLDDADEDMEFDSDDDDDGDDGAADGEDGAADGGEEATDDEDGADGGAFVELEQDSEEDEDHDSAEDDDEATINRALLGVDDDSDEEEEEDEGSGDPEEWVHMDGEPNFDQDVDLEGAILAAAKGKSGEKRALAGAGGSGKKTGKKQAGKNGGAPGGKKAGKNGVAPGKKAGKNGGVPGGKKVGKNGGAPGGKKRASEQGGTAKKAKLKKES